MQCYQMSLSFAGVPSYMEEYDYTVGSTCSVIKCP